MKVSDHVINAGGKRMRPLMTLLISRMIKDEQYKLSLELGAITEMLHTATLVHDDVIDESGMRRGRPTANATWNNATAVLVGGLSHRTLVQPFDRVWRHDLIKAVLGRNVRHCRRRSLATATPTQHRDDRK